MKKLLLSLGAIASVAAPVAAVVACGSTTPDATPGINQTAQSTLTADALKTFTVPANPTPETLKTALGIDKLPMSVNGATYVWSSTALTLTTTSKVGGKTITQVITVTPKAAVDSANQEKTDFADMSGTQIAGQPFQLKILTSGTMFANGAIVNGAPAVDFTQEGNTRPYPQTSTTAGYWVAQDVSNGDKIGEINDSDNFKDADVIAKNVTKLSSTLKGYAYQGTGDAKDTNVHVWLNKAAAMAAAKANVEYKPGVRVSTLTADISTLSPAEQKIITDANAAIEAVFNA